jgi:dihydrofolate reductase
LDAFGADGQDYGYAEFLKRIGTVIMGATTYRQVLGFGEWPYSGLAAYVITHQDVTSPPDAGIKAHAGDLKPLVARIKTESPKDIWLLGGSDLIRSFIEEDLIDEYRIFVMPLLLGSGIPLFKPFAGPQRELSLAGSITYPGGAVELRYRRPA